MAHNQHHIIGQIVLDVETPNQSAETWALQENMSQMLQQALPEIERLFDQWFEPNQVVRLDQLVLDLPPVDALRLADEFVPQLLSALKQALSDVASVRSHPPSAPPTTLPNVLTQAAVESDWDVFLYFLDYGRLPWWQTETTLSTWISRWENVLQGEPIWQEPLRQLLADKSISRQRWVTQLPNAFQLRLLLQLQPAWASWPALLTTAKALLQNFTTEETETSFQLSPLTLRYLEQRAWLTLLAEIKPNTSIGALLPTRRWIQTWLAEVVTALTTVNQRPSSFPRSPADSTPLSSEDSSVALFDSSPTTVQRSIHQHLRQLIITRSMTEPAVWLAAVDAMIAAEPNTPTIQTAANSSQIASANTTSEPITRSSDYLRLDNSPDSLPSTLPPSPDDTITQQTEQSPISSSPLDSAIPSTALPEAASDDLAEFQSVNAQSELSLSSSQNFLSSNPPPSHPLMLAPPKQATMPILSQAEASNGIYVTHAGLVLLHPFLRIYFEDVGLLTNNRFCHEYGQQVAIRLLHYLATGQTNAPEYELVMPKLLCGWPLNEPVMSSIDLPEAVLTEGRNLLKTVITYWEVLKNTSIDGLQEGFLQRSGKLTQTDNWKLQVEQQSIDILLSRLPWGLSMVKLPWMSDILVVEWT